MNNKQLAYTVTSILCLIFSVYSFYKSIFILGIILAIGGIILGIMSTSARKNKLLYGIAATIAGLILGYLLLFFFLPY